MAQTEFKLAASDAIAKDHFGRSVSIDGDYAIVGAHYSAYIFVRSGTTWTQQAKLTDTESVPNYDFGYSVSISGDYAIVGDPTHISASAYIFFRSGTTWTQQGKIRDNRADVYGFGYSVSITDDYAIVGTYDSDKAYIFMRSGTSWSLNIQLTDDLPAGDRFGNSVSITDDYAIVGALKDDDHGSNSGSVYIFYRNGTTWNNLAAKLTASDAAEADYFGKSVSITNDYAIVGAYRDDGLGYNSGSAYVFSRSENTWTQHAKLNASDAATDDYFGMSVTINDIGDLAIVGAGQDDDDGSNSGSAYVFSRSGNTWTQHAKLKAIEPAAGGIFGERVSISDGYAIVGAPFDDYTDANGSAYVYNLAPPAVTTPPSLSFGDVALGTSRTDSVVVKNPGTAALSVSSITVTGTDLTLFTVSAASLDVAPARLRLYSKSPTLESQAGGRF